MCGPVHDRFMPPQLRTPLSCSASHATLLCFALTELLKQRHARIEPRGFGIGTFGARRRVLVVFAPFTTSVSCRTENWSWSLFGLSLVSPWSLLGLSSLRVTQSASSSGSIRKRAALFRFSLQPQVASSLRASPVPIVVRSFPSSILSFDLLRFFDRRRRGSGRGDTIHTSATMSADFD